MKLFRLPGWSLAAIALWVMTSSLAETRGFSVRDSIEMVRFSEPSGLEKDAQVVLSPDQRYFAVVTTRGLLGQNLVESTLSIFDTKVVQRFIHSPGSTSPPAPKVLTTITAVPSMPSDSSYEPAISDTRWGEDSQTLYFLGQNSLGERQLYRVGTSNSAAIQLTGAGYNVRQFDVCGGTILYTAWNSRSIDSDGFGSRDKAFSEDSPAVTGMSLKDILFPSAFQTPHVLEQWRIHKGQSRRVLDRADTPSPDLEVYQDVLSVAPGGKLAVRLLPVKEVPAAWEGYRPAPGLDGKRIHQHDSTLLAASNRYRLRQYELVDLQTGKAREIVNAPNGNTLGYLDVNHAVWSRDGRQLLITNTFLPLDGAERTERVDACAAAVIDVSSLTANCVVFSRDKPLRLQQAAFGKSNDEVVLKFDYHGSDPRIEQYRHNGEAWALEKIITGRAARETKSFTVTVKQSLNDPPVLWASDQASGQGKELWNPNPQLSTLKLGEVSVYHWKDKSGYEWTGGLVKPVDYVPGKRYPLVIQTHGFTDYLFMTDGQFTTAMAARPLASVGIMVLQMEHRGDHFTTAEEASDQIGGFRAAVDQLSSEGMIDSTRVGIIGFSRTCWYVESALTVDPKLFAAATIADGVDESYMQYLLFAEVNPNLAKEFERINGGKPFGEPFKSWIKRAPGFHMDSVRTPLRIEAIGPLSVLMEWQTYASLRQQGKPVDLIYLPAGQHILQKPRERYASQQGTVDWFRFWLQDIEDTVPSKRRRYRQWESMKRELQDLNIESER